MSNKSTVADRLHGIKPQQRIRKGPVQDVIFISLDGFLKTRMEIIRHLLRFNDADIFRQSGIEREGDFGNLDARLDIEDCNISLGMRTSFSEGSWRISTRRKTVFSISE